MGRNENYKSIVLTPNICQEICELAMKEFELEDKWRNPVAFYPKLLWTNDRTIRVSKRINKSEID